MVLSGAWIFRLHNKGLRLGDLVDPYQPMGPETLLLVPSLWFSISVNMGAHDRMGRWSLCRKTRPPSVSAGVGSGAPTDAGVRGRSSPWYNCMQLCLPVTYTHSPRTLHPVQVACDTRHRVNAV